MADKPDDSYKAYESKIDDHLKETRAFLQEIQDNRNIAKIELRQQFKYDEDKVDEDREKFAEDFVKTFDKHILTPYTDKIEDPKVKDLIYQNHLAVAREQLKIMARQHGWDIFNVLAENERYADQQLTRDQYTIVATENVTPETLEHAKKYLLKDRLSKKDLAKVDLDQANPRNLAELVRTLGVSGTVPYQSLNQELKKEPEKKDSEEDD
ncbi:MAG: hypothetical protein MAG795_00332 [Candidatus Woesearchaeota archaeon]|nr:hypothetical protein [Candidatus Woesearchaeota archaeon]